MRSIIGTCLWTAGCGSSSARWRATWRLRDRTFTAVSDRSGLHTIQVPPGSYVVIAGNADRRHYQHLLTLRPDDTVKLDLSISLPTGV
jgi:hypothetical protein